MNNKFSGAILAGTLLITALPSFAVTYGTEKNGKWNLISNTVSRDFQPDGISDKQLNSPVGGKWALIDNQVTREFLPDTDPGHKAPGGFWGLEDISFDRQFVPDTASTAKAGTREIKRSMIGDKLTYGANFTDRVKNYGASSTEYRNEYNKEELMGTDNYQSVSGSYAYTIQNFRIDNHKDKFIHHPFASTFNYAETLKHNYTFSVVNEVTTRISFKDAVYGNSTTADLVEQSPDTVLSETEFAPTGKKLSYSSALPHEAPRVNSSAAVALAPTGDDLEGPIHVVTAGAKQQRIISDSVKRNDKIASATTENAQDKVLMSNTQVGGNASAKVTYSGVKEYKAQGLATMQVSAKTTTVEERKEQVGKDFSDRVDSVKDAIEKITEKSNAKKIESVIETIKDAYALADTQAKKDLLKQEVVIAISDSSLTAEARQSIQAILEGKTSAASTVTTPVKVTPVVPVVQAPVVQAPIVTKPVVPTPVVQAPVVSVLPPAANDRGTSVGQDHRGHGDHNGWSGRDSNKWNGRGDKPATPRVAPTPKPDPVANLLVSLNGRNQELAYYLNLARTGGNPVTYINKASSYLKTKDDLSALMTVLDEQIDKAKDSFKLITAAALGTEKLTINAKYKKKLK